MKPNWFASVFLAVALVIGAAGLSPAQEEKWESESYFGPQNAWKVTVVQADQQLAVLQIPEGFFLSIYSSSVPQEDDKGTPHRFQGRMLVKAAPLSELDRAARHSEGGAVRNVPMNRVMAGAPLKLMLEDAVVTVEESRSE